MATTLVPETKTDASAGAGKKEDKTAGPHLNHRVEEDFVESMVRRQESGELPNDRGRTRAAREEREAGGKKEEKKEAGKAESKSTTSSAGDGTTTQEPKDGQLSESTPKTDDGKGTQADASETEKKDGDAAAESTETGGGEGGAKEKEKKDEGGAAAEPTESELATEARTLLKKHGVGTVPDDLPAEMRPLWDKRNKEITAMATRAMQEARSYRGDEAKFRAHERFVAEHPADSIVELVLADDERRSKMTEEERAKAPDLLTRVNERMKKLETEDGTKVLRSEIRDERAAAMKEIEKHRDWSDQVQERGDEIETYLRESCDKLALPFEIVEQAVIAKLSEKPLDKREAGLTDEELDAIIGQQNRIFSAAVGRNRQQTRKEEIQGRTQDKKTTSPAARGSGGAAPSPARQKAPTTDAEFIDQMVAQRGG